MRDGPVGLGKTVKPRVNKLEDFGGKDLVFCDLLAHILGGDIRRFQHLSDVGDDTGKRGEGSDFLHDATKIFPFHYSTAFSRARI